MHGEKKEKNKWKWIVCVQLAKNRNNNNSNGNCSKTRVCPSLSPSFCISEKQKAGASGVRARIYRRKKEEVTENLSMIYACSNVTAYSLQYRDVSYATSIIIIKSTHHTNVYSALLYQTIHFLFL